MSAAPAGGLPAETHEAAIAEAACAQCGRPGPDVIRLTRRTVRFSCRTCGAVVSARTADVAAGRGLWSRAPLTPEPSEEDPLAAFMPAPMVRWLRDRDGDPSEAPDRSAVTAWYSDYDRAVHQAGESATARGRFEGVTGVRVETLPARPPAFAKVISALNSSFYEDPVAVESLVAAGFEPGATAERVRHGHRWLATAGRSSTWIHRDTLIDPGAEAVKALLEPGGLGEGLRGPQVQVFYAAVFGVAKGPSARGVVTRFTAARVESALTSYLESGERPLRAVVLATLDGE